jgi:hypothetical protein
LAWLLNKSVIFWTSFLNKRFPRRSSTICWIDSQTIVNVEGHID